MPRSARRKILGIGQLTGAIAVAALLTAGLMMFPVVSMGIAARNSVEAFDKQPCDVDVAGNTPAQRSTLYASDGKTPIASFYTQNREVVKFADIPEIARKAVISIEDRRFYEHHGVDVQSVARAMVQNSQSGEVVQGGSTLTMQYVKLLRQYNATSTASQKAAVAQTTTRKLADARCALTLENTLSKDEILARYLNIAYFGGGAYGIQTAAKSYFGIPASQLSLDQAALLAGLVQSPIRYDPRKHAKAAKERRDTVLNEMLSLGYVNAQQAAEAKSKPIVAQPAVPSTQGCANANNTIQNVGFFCSYAVQYLSGIGITPAELDSKGYKIVTTLDPNVQNAAQSAVSGKMPANRKAASVMDVLDSKSGEVRAFAVSRKYGNDKADPTQTAVPLNTQPAAGSGSTYKVFTMVYALKEKVPLTNYTINLTNRYPSQTCKTWDHGKQKPYTAKNASNGYREGDWNMQDAAIQSSNTFFVALLDQRFNCDLTGTVDTADAMGMHNSLQVKGSDGKTPYGQQVKNEKQATFTLGPHDTSPLDLASAYATLANDGKYCPPTPIRQITDAAGKAVAGLPERTCKQVVDPGIAHTVSNVLVGDTHTSAGTAEKRFQGYYGAGGSPVAGKTGTASAGDTGQNSAAWFVGYTPDYTASVATFNPGRTSFPLEDVPGYEHNTTGIFGSFSAGIWVEALGPILLNHAPWQFPASDDQVVNGDSVGVPNVVGQDVNTAMQTLQQYGFSVQVASDRQDGYPQNVVAAQSPSGRATQGQMITLTVGSGNGAGGNPGGGPGGGNPGGGNPGGGNPGGGNPGGGNPGGGILPGWPGGGH